METLTADEMSERLGISRETFRRIWKIYPHIPVGRGKPDGTWCSLTQGWCPPERPVSGE